MCSTKKKIGIRANKACMWFPVGVAFRSNWGWGLPEAFHFFQEAVKARQDVMMFQPERLHFTFQKCNQKSMVHGGFVELSRIFAPTHMFHHHVPNPMHIYPHNISSKSSLNTWFIRVPLHLTQLRSISHSIQHWFAWTQLMRFRLRINQPLNKLIIEYSQAPSIYQYNLTIHQSYLGNSTGYWCWAWSWCSSPLSRQNWAVIDVTFHGFRNQPTSGEKPLYVHLLWLGMMVLKIVYDVTTVFSCHIFPIPDGLQPCSTNLDV